MKTYDLTQLEDRKAAIENLNNECKKAFIDNGFEAAPDCKFDILSGAIKIMSGNPLAAISLYSSYSPYGRAREVEMNHGISDSYTPANRSSYWRTIHAASILKNWDKLVPLVDKCCTAYRELEKEIFKVNK